MGRDERESGGNHGRIFSKVLVLKFEKPGINAADFANSAPGVLKNRSCLKSNTAKKTNTPVITYHLSVDEDSSGPFVAEEWLQWCHSKKVSKPFRFFVYKKETGHFLTGDMPEESDARIEENLDSPEVLEVNTLGQLSRHPRVSALRRFITRWYLSYFTAKNMRGIPEADPQERLSATGDNLPRVVKNNC